MEYLLCVRHCAICSKAESVLSKAESVLLGVYNPVGETAVKQIHISVCTHTQIYLQIRVNGISENLSSNILKTVLYQWTDIRGKIF